MAVLDKLSVPIGTKGEGSGDFSPGTLMPKLQFRFRVLFINMGDGNNTDRATTNVVSVTRPNITHDEVIIDTYNSKIYMAGKHTWEPVTIELRDDIGSSTSKLLDQQIARQIDMATQSSKQGPDSSESATSLSYKFQIEIENLDGANPHPLVLDKWVLSGCYIANLTYNETNYSSGGEYQTISVQVRYDNAEHIVKKIDYLSNVASQGTGGGGR